MTDSRDTDRAVIECNRLAAIAQILRRLVADLDEAEKRISLMRDRVTQASGWLEREEQSRG